MTGTLFLIVGPSGSGKDSVIDTARLRLAQSAGGSNILFARRTITRVADPDGEDHVPATEAAFETDRAAGRFTLDWSAHGLRYGISADQLAPLAEGRAMVANVSRTILAAAAQRFRARIIEITASPETRQ